MLLSYQGQELEVRSIGDEGWQRQGSVWEEEVAPPVGEGLLSPAAICDDLLPNLSETLEGSDFRRQIVGGVDTRRYHLDAADLQDIATLLGPGGGGEVPKEFTVDTWLAEDGGWPVKLVLVTEGSDEEGQPSSVGLFMEFRDIDDPTMKIEPPQTERDQT